MTKSETNPNDETRISRARLLIGTYAECICLQRGVARNSSFVIPSSFVIRH